MADQHFELPLIKLRHVGPRTLKCVYKGREAQREFRVHAPRLPSQSIWRLTDVIWRHQWRLNLPWSRSCEPWLNGGLGGKKQLK